MASDHWNLKWVKADKAWALLPQDGQGGIDWGDIRVAHLDTGYTEHEAFGAWTGAPPRQNAIIQTQLGKDYLKPRRPTAEDPMKQGTLLHPGHGTRSGSALSGDDPGNGFNGIAPGLPLIPCRVTDSSLIDVPASRAIAKAIDAAIDGSSAQVVSISLGQLIPFKVMGKAIDKAYEKGVIIVAAAGQEVDRVVYPGKHRRVLAVAGVKKRGKRYSVYYKYDSYARIDAWAPAEPIRRATTPPGAGYGFGDGTTYATLHVTAAAAMWLRHRGDDIDATYGKRNWRRIEAFRKLLFDSQRPLPFKTKSLTGNRAGRIDIKRLLESPLPAKNDLREETDLAADDLF
jgi:subtilisin family serine protease